MAEDTETHETQSNKTSITLNSSSSKSDVEIRREKKKKLAAFQTFLDNKLEPAPLEDLPRRNFSSYQMQQQRLQGSNTCCICKEYLTHQSKLCEFCKETVCATHFRKRRRNNNTNKWTRICEHCQDKYLMEKHYQNEMRTEQSLITQQIILQNKSKETKQLLQSKRIKLQLLLNKKASITQSYNKQMARIASENHDIDKKMKIVEGGLRDNGNLEYSLMSLQKKLPVSLQADYQFLQSQNMRITKDLVKYQKLCIDAIKARTQKQRDMYKQYYQWEQQKRREIEAAQKTEEECCIY